MPFISIHLLLFCEKIIDLKFSLENTPTLEFSMHENRKINICACFKVLPKASYVKIIKKYNSINSL